MSKGKDTRLSRGRIKEDVTFPVAPTSHDLSRHYPELLKELKDRISHARLKTVLAANAALVTLYWEIGNTILQKQTAQGWGAKVIDPLSHDLGETFPDMKGFSLRNLKYMRAFAAAWQDKEIVQRVIAQIISQTVSVKLPAIKRRIASEAN